MPVSYDPLDEVLKPPPNETPEQCQLRLSRETEAKRVSMLIDANIQAERQARRKKRIVRLLLLGQSESGKSTTLRQFQRLYTPTAFREERILWRAIIQLNIIRSIRTILEALSYPTSYLSPESRTRRISQVRQSDTSLTYSPPFPPTNVDITAKQQSTCCNGDGFDTQFSHGSPRQYSDPDFDHPDSDIEFTLANNSFDYNYGPRSEPFSSTANATLATTPLDALKARLLPLRHIEALLIAKLVPPNEDEATHFAGPSNYQNGVDPSHGIGMYTVNDNRYGHVRKHSHSNQEIFVRPGASWKGALARARVKYPSFGRSNSSSSSLNNDTAPRRKSAGSTGLETPDEPQTVLYSCRNDIIQLWNDQCVREILRRKKIRLEDASGFFLDDIERVTCLKYMPSDDDVLKARLKTVGVSEYKFEMEVGAGRDSSTEWRIVDVGGSRSQRSTWAPFFDDVDAIIFLAPISGFDQVLAEDRNVNRLEDSVLLWKAVCSNKLLANVDLVLFLNKCDLLEKKLNSGIRLTKYVRTYGERGNDLDSVSKYLRGKFSAIHREYSPNPRKFYAFCTSVTDTATTAGIIASVRDKVIRQHLKQSKLL